MKQKATSNPFTGKTVEPVQITAEANDPEQVVKVRRVRGIDPEIQALARLDRILADLEPEQAVRALQWLEGRYGVEARYTISE